MPSIALADIRAKIDRANKNIDHLKKFLPGRELSEVSGDLATIEPQSDGQTHDVFIEGIGNPPLPLRLAVGDVIHDLRTSLDHLAYQLAILNRFPVRGARTRKQEIWFRRLNFLIHDTKERFDSAAGNIKKVIGSGAVAEMERLQPYKGSDPRSSILWILSELDNITKHRVIVAVDQQLDHAVVDLTIAGRTISGIVKNASAASLKNRTKLFGVRLVPDQLGQPPPKVDVNIKAVSSPIFADTDGLCDGKNIFVVMRDSVAAVGSVVDDFERLFF